MDPFQTWIRRYVVDEPYRRLDVETLWAKFRDHGDEAAFRIVLERVGPRVYARCRAILPTEDLAEEAFQTAFVELVRNRARLSGYGPAVAWILKTAFNTAKAIARRNRRSRSREALVAVAASRGVTGADEAVIRNDLASAVQRALVGLPERERQAIELVYFEGMTHAEAAKTLRWRRSAVGTYLQRGLDRMRGKLMKVGFAVGGLTTIESALRAAPPSLSVERVANWSNLVLAEAKWATATAVGLGLPRAWVAASLVAGASVVGGVAVWQNHFVPAPILSGVVQANVPTVPEANRRAFDEIVRPRLQAALESLLAGDGGRAVITDVVTRGTVVQVAVELRHGPPQTHVSRLELLYCTHRRTQLFHLDAWGTGTYQNANPRDPITLARNRVGVPDLTQPSTGLRDVHSALALLPVDPRGYVVEAEYREALARIAHRHAGVWLVRGDPGRPVRVAAYQHWFWPVAFKFPGRTEIHPHGLDLRWADDGRVAATCGDLGGVNFSANGTRIDFPRTGDWLVRATSEVP